MVIFGGPLSRIIGIHARAWSERRADTQSVVEARKTMKPRPLLVFLLVLTVLAGCASVQEKTARLEKQHPEWGESTIQKVAAGQVEPGMTDDMVIAAVGRKGEVNAGPQFGEEVWIYYRGVTRGQGASWEPVYWIYFKNGKVVGTEGERWRVAVW